MDQRRGDIVGHCRGTGGVGFRSDKLGGHQAQDRGGESAELHCDELPVIPICSIERFSGCGYVRCRKKALAETARVDQTSDEEDAKE